MQHIDKLVDVPDVLQSLADHVASGSCTEASNNCITKAVHKEKEVEKEERKEKGRRRETKEQGQGGHKKAEEYMKEEAKK